MLTSSRYAKNVFGESVRNDPNYNSATLKIFPLGSIRCFPIAPSSNAAVIPAAAAPVSAMALAHPRLVSDHPSSVLKTLHKLQHGR